MAIIPRSGSFEPTSQQKVEPHITPGEVTKNIDGNRYFLPNDGLLSNDKIVKDTLLNRTAWNVDRWASSINMLAGYTDGFPIAVTYYNQDIDNGNVRNNPTDTSTSVEHTVHKNYVKIYNMELRFINGMEFNFDKDENISTVDFSFYTPPGFVPVLGDLFLFLLNDGKWGVFSVSDIERLSISQASFHKCDCDLVQYITQDYQNYLEESVIDKRYYDKQKYYTNNMTLLTSESWIQMTDIKQLKKELISIYVDLFYNGNYSSFVRPDGNYDPYVIEFWHTKISVDECHTRPMQLIPELRDYKDTIWSCFTNKSRNNNPVLCSRYEYIGLRRNHLWHAGITPLIHNKHVVVCKDKQNESDTNIKTYIFSNSFYEGKIEGMSLFEQMIYESLCGKVKIKDYIEFVANYRSWNKELSFYYIPICLYLLDLAYYNVVD